MAVKRILPPEALDLIKEGWKYVDVRSIPEFTEGHPEGAYNVPFMHRTGARLTPNPDFARVMEAAFDKQDRLILGCRSGGRSLRAAQTLTSMGFANVVDMHGGFVGDPGKPGSEAVDGWEPRGYPVTREAESGHSYSELEQKTSSE